MNDSTRPNPSKGVFETLLVVDDCPVELEAHLDRLGASVEQLYSATASTDPRAAIEEGARGLELGRLRVTLAPAGAGELSVEIVTAEVDPALVFPDWKRAVSARSFLLEGGLGAHKWVDRKLLEETEMSLSAEGAVPLIVDHGGAVLETSRANVFAVRGGTLFTPAADGRILPGITRGRVLEATRALELPTAEGELTIGDLIAADEVFLAGSIRGVEPVGWVDGAPLRHGGDATARIAAELRRAWMPERAGVH